MWEIIKKLSLSLLALLLFASCDNEEYGQEENTGGGSEKIHFEITVGKATATPSGVETRVVTDPTTHETKFENGDQIGVYIVKGSGGLQSAGNWVDNMKMTYNNGKWIPTFPSGKEYYPTDGDKLNFYAYYPYDATVPDALNMNISGLTDQSSATNLSKSDLLYASTRNVGKGITPVQLAFSHALTLVELSVTGGGAGAEMSSEVAVTLEGCKPDVSFNWSTRAAGASGSVKSVKMRRVEQSGDANYLTKYTYRALVPTQTVFTGAELFRFSRTQGTIIRALSHKVPSGYATLLAGQVKPYTIRLQPTIDPNHVYVVGDYYPYKGFPILGVVFEISNGGKNGKIVDLSYLLRHTIRWGIQGIDEQAKGVVGVRDWNDGYTSTRNMIDMNKGKLNFADNYKLFNWIYETKNDGEINGMWYIPAVNELLTLIDHLPTVNTKLRLDGMPEIPMVFSCQTSTEYSANSQSMVDLSSKTIRNGYVKGQETWAMGAIAIGKF